ncbi:hypothetical protein QL285_053526 [Trifolium repens]|nr:hypothetical protein QL285_053526 [Trifolium repens]
MSNLISVSFPFQSLRFLLAVAFGGAAVLFIVTFSCISFACVFGSLFFDGVVGIITFFAFCSLCYYDEKHPLYYFLLLIFTVSVALSVGFTCNLAGGLFKIPAPPLGLRDSSLQLIARK